ncbi:hypothetical protein FACS189485_16160 [Spirochaetia bacterium]|nr:hypothetical protein FACS189485_16160 [Spirochaetia bacterium]
MKNWIDNFLNSKLPQIVNDRQYEKNTVNSPNPFARLSHRNRVKKCVTFIVPRLELGKVLDYGCGTGLFVSILNSIKPGIAIGYEPYITEKFERDAKIFSSFDDILSLKPFFTITLFEVIEHLSNSSLEEFLTRSTGLLGGGGIYVSAPIEIGPVIIVKELYRILNRKNSPYGHTFEYTFFEFVKAAFFGIAGKRPGDGSHGYGPHKGFDFRKTIKFIESKGWKVTVLGYGPLPIIGWYGNSQVFFKMESTKK